ncbi:TetR/AcrR family transcriptional regulator, partial [Streptomyces sp. NPDC057757]
MRTRDPEAKKKQLFEAALAEFAAFGLAGARVDRLAERAGISPGLVYSFYKGKAELYDALFEDIVELTVSSVPIDADHLPEYAGALHDI